MLFFYAQADFNDMQNTESKQDKHVPSTQDFLHASAELVKVFAKHVSVCNSLGMNFIDGIKKKNKLSDRGKFRSEDYIHHPKIYKLIIWAVCAYGKVPQIFISGN